MKDFLINNWQLLVEGAISLTSFVLLMIKLKNKGKQLSFSIIKEILIEKIKEFTELAETFKNYSPEEKHQFVKTRAKEYLLGEGISLSEELIDSIIDSDIAHTKKVNMRDKDEMKDVS